MPVNWGFSEGIRSLLRSACSVLEAFNERSQLKWPDHRSPTYATPIAFKCASLSLLKKGKLLDMTHAVGAEWNGQRLWHTPYPTAGYRERVVMNVLPNSEEGSESVSEGGSDCEAYATSPLQTIGFQNFFVEKKGGLSDLMLTDKINEGSDNSPGHSDDNDSKSPGKSPPMPVNVSNHPIMMSSLGRTMLARLKTDYKSFWEIQQALSEWRLKHLTTRDECECIARAIHGEDGGDAKAKAEGMLQALLKELADKQASVGFSFSYNSTILLGESFGIMKQWPL